MTQNPKTSFKKSNITWIGDIPEDWEVKKLKFVFKYATGGTPSSGKSDYYDSENGYNWITISDLNGKYTGESKNKITELAIKDANMQIVPKGSLLYSFKLSVGQLAFVSEDTYTNEAILSIFPKEGLNLDFWYYALQAYFISNANENIYGAKIFNQFAIDNGFVISPPFLTQTAIANFLDAKTEKISTLISNKKKLIELLKEQKQSIIHRTVTKGIDPNAKMKDSGIPWIGEIPQSWTTTKLKFLLKHLTDGSHISVKSISEGHPYVTVANIDEQTGKIDLEGCQKISDEDYSILMGNGCKPKIGDILFSQIGTIGLTVEVKENDNFVMLSSLAILSPNNVIVDTQFLITYLRSSVIKEQYLLKMDGGAVKRITLNHIANFAINLPSIEIQHSIVEYIEKEVTQIDSAIAKIEQEITLIEEYQTSLIYQAVTGKISIS